MWDENWRKYSESKCIPKWHGFLGEMDKMVLERKNANDKNSIVCSCNLHLRMSI